MYQASYYANKGISAKRTRYLLSSLRNDESKDLKLAAFVDMLNNMRLGKLDDHAIRAFQRLSRPLHYEDGIGPTQMYVLV